MADITQQGRFEGRVEAKLENIENMLRHIEIEMQDHNLRIRQLETMKAKLLGWVSAVGLASAAIFNWLLDKVGIINNNH